MKVKFAQYGISHAHARGKAAVLKANADVDFRGVYEPDPEVRRTLGDAEAYEGVRWFESKEEMLDDGTIAAIAVEGEVGQNPGFAREVIGRGKHIWLDKPAGADWEAFRELIAIAEDKGLLVQLGYMFRYHAGFQFILDWARDQKLGDIFSVRGRMSTFLGGEARRRQSVYRGGILFELLCHLVDIVVAMLGRPERVTSFLRSDLGTETGFRDNTAAVLEYPKTMVLLESAAMEVSANPSRRLEVYGTRGSAIMEPFEREPVLRVCLDEERDGFVKGWQAVPLVVRPRYVGSLEALVADIRGEKRPDRTLAHELTVQETVLRASGVLE